MKIDEHAAGSDRSGTDPEDSEQGEGSGAPGGANYGAADITDVSGYEHIFRPRRRELNRTPTKYLDAEPPFEAPMASGSESENNLVAAASTAAAAAPPGGRPSNLRLSKRAPGVASSAKQISPSPTRRSSQPAMSGGNNGGYGSSPELGNAPQTGFGNRLGNGPVRVRRTSTNSTNSAPRPVSVYDQQQTLQPQQHQGQLSSSPTSRYQRSTSVQPRSSGELNQSANGGDVSPPIRDQPHHHHNGGRAQSVTRQPPPAGFTPLTPVSRIQIGGGDSPSSASTSSASTTDRPLDRPTLVRPSRTSLQHDSPSQHLQQQQQGISSQQQPDPLLIQYYNNTPPHYAQQQQLQQQQQMLSSSARFSQPDLTQLQYHQQHPPQQLPQQPTAVAPASNRYGSPVKQQRRQQQQQVAHQPPPTQQRQPQFHEAASSPALSNYPGAAASSGASSDFHPEKEKFEVIPMNADKPSGLELDEFLPKKMQGLGIGTGSSFSSSSSSSTSRFSAYKGYTASDEFSEAEVTSSMLKGHESMMSVLATRGRNIEIVHKLWQNKDAKTGAPT